MDERLASNKGLILSLFICVYISFPLFPDTYGTNLESLLYALCIFLMTFSFLIMGRVKLDVFILIYFFYIMTAVLISLLLDDTKGWLSNSGLLEIFKVFSYFMIFTFFYNIGIYKPRFITDQLLRPFAILFVFFGLFNLGDILIPDSIFSLLANLMYKRESVPILNGMAIAPFMQTYHYAAFMLIPVIYSYITFLKNFNFFNFLMFSFFSLSLFLSQSRTAFLAYCITIFLVSLLYSSKKLSVRLMITLFFLIIFVFLFGYVYYYHSESFSYIIIGLTNMLEGNSNSMNIRASQIDSAMSGLLLIGSGIAKEYFFLESVPALYLWRYGLIGLFAFYFIVFYTSYIASRLYNLNNRDTVFGALSIWFLVYPIMSLSSAHHDTPKLAIVFYGSMGLIFSYYKFTCLDNSKVNIEE